MDFALVSEPHTFRHELAEHPSEVVQGCRETGLWVHTRRQQSSKEPGPHPRSCWKVLHRDPSPQGPVQRLSQNRAEKSKIQVGNQLQVLDTPCASIHTPIQGFSAETKLDELGGVGPT